MKLILSLIFIFILFLMPCRAEETSPCPTISVAAPKGVALSGEPLTFIASVSSNEIAGDFKIEYHWTISAGTIAAGQKTPAIVVDTTDNSGISVVATVEIKGLAKNCLNTASGAGLIGEPPKFPIHNCDDYGELPIYDEYGRLDSLAVTLQNSNNVIAVIHVTSKKINTRVSRIFNYLTKRRGVARNQLIFAIKKGDDEYTEICQWDKENVIIDCKDCQVIKGEDFSPKKLKGKTF